jgi:hypothetical protein
VRPGKDVLSQHFLLWFDSLNSLVFTFKFTATLGLRLEEEASHHQDVSSFPGISSPIATTFPASFWEPLRAFVLRKLENRSE